MERALDLTKASLQGVRWEAWELQVVARTRGCAQVCVSSRSVRKDMKVCAGEGRSKLRSHSASQGPCFSYLPGLPSLSPSCRKLTVNSGFRDGKANDTQRGLATPARVKLHNVRSSSDSCEPHAVHGGAAQGARGGSPVSTSGPSHLS